MKTASPITLALVELMFMSSSGRVCAQVWSPSGAPVANWNSIGCSADGQELVAATAYGGVYASTNGGNNWSLTSLPSGFSVACAANGEVFLAVSGGNSVSISTNSGVTWNSVDATAGPLSCVACSADGAVIIAAGFMIPLPMVICVSTNRGADWNVFQWQMEWQEVASSANGGMLAAVASGWRAGEGLFVSTNFGASWTDVSPPDGGSYQLWNSVAASADGLGLAVAGWETVTSTNVGADWTTTTLRSGSNPSHVECSADFRTMIAAVNPGLNGAGIYTSSDSGTTWVSNNVPATNWTAVALSADGCRLFGTVRGGGIYTAQITPRPILNIKASDQNLLLSWLVPSEPFALQQSSDLGTWSPVGVTPSLNVSNLHYEVSISTTGDKRFFRLVSQ